MTDLDSKLTGEKNINYVSDSDEEADGNESGHSGCEEDEQGAQEIPEEVNDIPDFLPSGAKTGPKGVLEDYKRYKALKKQEDIEETKAKKALIKKLAFTADPNKHKTENDDDDEDDFDEDDDFLKMYHQKRLAQLQKDMEKKLNEGLPKFDKLFEFSGNELVDAIDKEDSKVILVVHLYEPHVAACKQMNKCLECLVQQYPYVKFCKVHASNAGLSLKFKLNALPALQVYKGGKLIGNFIKMQDKLDAEFYAADVENFLLDSDILTSGTNFNDDHNEDSDYELD